MPGCTVRNRINPPRRRRTGCDPISYHRCHAPARSRRVRPPRPRRDRDRAAGLARSRRAVRGAAHRRRAADQDLPQPPLPGGVLRPVTQQQRGLALRTRLWAPDQPARPPGPAAAGGLTCPIRRPGVRQPDRCAPPGQPDRPTPPGRRTGRRPAPDRNRGVPPAVAGPPRRPRTATGTVPAAAAVPAHRGAGRAGTAAR